MKQTKTAYEVLKESGVYPEDFISFATMGGCENAMRAYAEQFIDAAAEEATLSYVSCGDPMTCGCQGTCEHPIYFINKKSILKLKEFLK